jgi:hypothetical protein
MIEDGAAEGSLVMLIFLIIIYFLRPWLYWPGRNR